MSFQLLVEGRFVGEFDSPLELIGHEQHYCRYCGTVFASRISDRPQALWNYISGGCYNCELSLYVRPWQSFRAPGEEAVGFAPLPILCEEFLFNSRGLFNERSC